MFRKRRSQFMTPSGGPLTGNAGENETSTGTWSNAVEIREIKMLEIRNPEIRRVKLRVARREIETELGNSAKVDRNRGHRWAKETDKDY